MSAAVCAQKLLFDAGALSGADTNALYRAWVQDVGLDGLLQLQRAEDPTHSLLSSDLVEAISRKHLTQRYDVHVPPTINRHPAAADQLWLGLALSNMNGVSYSQKTWPDDGEFTYTRYQDQYSIPLTPLAADDIQERWETIRRFAVSCGAFPFAFRMQEILRHASEYPGADMDPRTTSFPSQVETFVYTDGGVFQNEPLGLAKDLVDQIDKHQNEQDRVYLFVSPGVRSGTANLAFRERDANYKGALMELAGAIFQQARFHDWITAETVNQRIQLFNDRSVGLQKAILGRSINVNALGQVAGDILNLFFDPNDPAQAAARSAAEARLKLQFQPEYDALPAGANDAWIQAILAFETAAGIGDKDEMFICTVTASDAELASGQIFAFAGFFDQKYRDHDYNVGRKKAQLFLNKPPDRLGPIHYTPTQVPEPDPSLNGLTLDKIPEAERKKLKSRLMDRSYDILEELGVPTFLLREAIDKWLIGPQLDKLLKL